MKSITDHAPLKELIATSAARLSAVQTPQVIEDTLWTAVANGYVLGQIRGRLEGIEMVRRETGPA